MKPHLPKSVKSYRKKKNSLTLFIPKTSLYFISYRMDFMMFFLNICSHYLENVNISLLMFAELNYIQVRKVKQVTDRKLSWKEKKKETSKCGCHCKSVYIYF